MYTAPQSSPPDLPKNVPAHGIVIGDQDLLGLYGDVLPGEVHGNVVEGLLAHGNGLNGHHQHKNPLSLVGPSNIIKT